MYVYVGLYRAEKVAPREGAWIETWSRCTPRPASAKSHPVRVRGLKRFCAVPSVATLQSHPVRVRGLKRALRLRQPRQHPSHPVRVRGLKQYAVYISQ